MSNTLRGDYEGAGEVEAGISALFFRFCQLVGDHLRDNAIGDRMS